MPELDVHGQSRHVTHGSAAGRHDPTISDRGGHAAADVTLDCRKTYDLAETVFPTTVSTPLSTGVMAVKILNWKVVG
ncbi:hypothetical protein SVAN01_03657 [Stagonosporopsis vannaccii]|nr:hypothetical protein SVAN01_03657 [Stagonosporopsis vannaccii]